MDLKNQSPWMTGLGNPTAPLTSVLNPPYLSSTEMLYSSLLLGGGGCAGGGGSRSAQLMPPCFGTLGVRAPFLCP